VAVLCCSENKGLLQRLNNCVCCAAVVRCLQVDFPSSLDADLVAALSPVLPGNEAANGGAAMDSDDAEQCHMKHVEDFEEELKSRHRMARQASSNAYDSDDEDDMPRGGQRVQCAQQ
jgi:DnaJ family protein A protein 2